MTSESEPIVRRDRRVKTLTVDAVKEAMLPPNNCKVKLLMEKMSKDGAEALNYALAQDNRDLSARQIMELLVRFGYEESDIPGVDAIQAHRNGRKPCRCKG